MWNHHTKKVTQSQLPDQSFSGIYPVWKLRGETLAVLLERFRREKVLDATIKLTYAGRLDPMAEGIVLVLAGESRFQKDALLGLSKTYEVEVACGIATDTHDVLGLITQIAHKEIDPAKIEEVVIDMHAVTILPYPMYSSGVVQGKPLFVHARAGTSVEVPQKKVTIIKAELLGMRKESLSTLVLEIITDVVNVVGDFRQDEITETWKQILHKEGNQEIILANIRIHASSGTYMRSLAEWMGERLGMPALAYRIKRIRIGEYSIEKNK